MAHYSRDRLGREIMGIMSRHVNVARTRVFFFGSRVNGLGNERSDIDVGIEGPKPIPEETLERIRRDVSALPTLYRIDVVDFARADRNFRDVAGRHIEMIAPRP